MNKELIDYIQNTNDINAFNLASWYENQNHLSPACSYYLQCAESTKNESLAYECLLRLYLCYKQLCNRDYTCENLLKSAINLCPKKPEAYFLLSQFYEYKNNWLDSYLYASLGLSLPNRDPSGLSKNYGYESEYMLIFQKAVSSWWYGRPKESRKLFRKLKNEYIETINSEYYKLIENNLMSLGAGPDSETSIRYNISSDSLRFDFNGSDTIQKNFSQACQDLFVLAALNGKKNGTYLEIGSAHSFHNSNTALLEQLGWTGIGVEMNRELASMHDRERKNKVLCENALSLNYSKLLRDNFNSDIIDYLQLDIEPSHNTFEALLMMPFDKYKFRVITYEHDHYVDMSNSYREKSRRYLQNMGYTLVFNDIATIDGCSFEDWWVKEELIEPSILEKLLSYSKEEINLVNHLMMVSL